MNKGKETIGKLKLMGLLAINFLAAGNFIYGQDDTASNDKTLIINDRYNMNKSDIEFDDINIKKDGILGIYENYFQSKIKLEKINNIGTLTNEGVIEFPIGPDKPTELIIHGNYKGVNGKIKMMTLTSNFENTDLVFFGDYMYGGTHEYILSGHTDVISIDSQGKEQVIDGDIDYVNKYVDKFKKGAVESGEPLLVPAVYITSAKLENDDAFRGKVRTTGASEIQLYLNKKNQDYAYSDVDYYGYYWTAKTLNENQQQIFSQAVPGYVMMPKANVDLAFNSLRPVEKSIDNIWVRVLGSRNTTQGINRFRLKSINGGIQVGKNFKLNSNILGVYLSYQYSKLDFMDKYRSENGYVVEDKNAGSGNTNAFNLGLTATKYLKNGAYLDIIGQISLLNNNYNSRDKISAKNSGINIAISVEAGKPFIIKENKEKNSKIILEPQAQLIYQRLKMKDFSDGYKNISQGSLNNLKARIGTKLSYEDDKKTYYAKLNLWYNGINVSKTKIGKDILVENYNNTSVELGLGMTKTILKNTTIYGDISYNKSIGNGKNDIFKLSIGANYNF